jgi:predicted transcriptional regulator
MVVSVLSDRVIRFIRQHVGSIEKLEVLFLLAGRRQPWSAEDVARELRSSARSAQDHLHEFETSGLLSRVDDCYLFNPAEPMHATTVAELAQAYRERRLRVIEAIYGADGSPCGRDA